MRLRRGLVGKEEVMPARFGVQLPQTDISWAEYLALWQELDDSPFESAWTIDHFVTGRSEAEAHGGSCLEGWTALAAVAQATRRLRLGCLVRRGGGVAPRKGPGGGV